MIKEILYNLAILIAFSALSGFIDNRWKRNTTIGKILQGILFGTASVIGMFYPFVMYQGLIFDGRSVVLSLCSLFFGPLSGIISGGMALIIRLSIGGDGVLMGISVITESVVIGLIFNYLRQTKNLKLNYTNLYLFGLIVHIIMIALMSVLPRNIIWATFHNVAVSVIVLYPIASFIIAKILKDQEDNCILIKDLSESKEDLAITLNSIGDAVISTDENGRIVNMNPIAENLCGWKIQDRKDKLLLDVFNVINPETRIPISNPIEMIIKTSQSISFSNYSILISKDGKEIPISYKGAPLKNDKGNVIGIVVVFRDQTEEIAHQKALRESEAFIKVVLDNLPVGIAVNSVDPSVDFSYMNDNFAKIYRTSKELLFAQPDAFWDIVYEDPEFREIIKKRVLDDCASGNLEKMCWHDVPIVRKGKETSYITARNIPLQSEKIMISTVWDVTESKISEEKLRNSEERFRSTLENMMEGCQIIGFDWKYIYINNAACKHFRYLREGVLGKKFSDIWANTNETELFQNVKYCMEERTSIHTEIEFNFLDNTNAWFSLGIQPIPEGVFILSIDISDRKYAENELRDSEEKYKQLFENAAEAIFVAQHGKIVFHNAATNRIIDRDNEHISANPFIEYIYPEDRELVLDRHIRRIKGEILESRYNFRIIGKDNQLKWVELNTVLINWKGKPATLNFMLDINDRKLVEEEILREKNFSDQLIESLPGIFYMFDQNFKPIRWNQNKAKFLGLSDVQMKTHNTLNYIVDSDREKVVRSFKKTFMEGESQEIISIIRYDGVEFAYQLTGKRFDTKEGPFLLGVGIDISERMKMEHELMVALEKAEESDRLKTAFLQNISHEIRTPLNGIIGFSNLLASQEVSDEEIQEFSEIIRQSGNRLLEIVNNVLDISKIETGQIEIQKNLFSVNSMLANLYSFFSPLAKMHDLSINYHNYLNNDNFIFYSDESKLNQIFTNLINNAIKFTFTGGVDFGFDIEDEQIIFYVKDTGIGIPKNMYDTIFDRFIQADVSISRNFEGAGLGLSICKGLVELLGGKIWIESELNQGTTFYFSLPITKAPNIELVEREQISDFLVLDKIKILVAEDDYTSYLYLSKLLNESNVQIIWAENGEKAVDFIRNNSDIDLILMDIRMPILDGFTAAHLIKAINPNIPIIAQTAYAFTEERDKALSSDFSGYVIKPIERIKLLELIRKHIKDKVDFIK